MPAKAPVALATIAAVPLLGASLPAAGSYTVALTGQAEVNQIQPQGFGGDMNGSGLARLTVDPASRRICYDFTVSGLATPLMAHIHKGATLETGPSVVTLFTGPGGDLDGCVMWTEKWLAQIVADPSDFYINLSTTEYPDGALRGQLPG